MNIEAEELKKFMEGFKIDYREHREKVEFYLGVLAGFDLVKHWIKVNEGIQDKGQDKQFVKGDD